MLSLVLVFVFAFSLVASMATPAKADIPKYCCVLVNHCADGDIFGWGIRTQYGDCIKDITNNCPAPAACKPM